MSQSFERFDSDLICCCQSWSVDCARLEIVVKVQRRTLKEIFDINLKNLRYAGHSRILAKDGANGDQVVIYDECTTVLYQEIDYSSEATNAELFYAMGFSFCADPVAFRKYCCNQLFFIIMILA